MIPSMPQSRPSQGFFDGLLLPNFPDAMPVQGLIGGLMIGAAAAIMLLGIGRIAGVSGMLARGMGFYESTLRRRVALAFVIGLPIGAFVFNLFAGPIETNYAPTPVILIVGGMIVGYGTRVGSGCTSGHGVCGVSRLSPRSLIATAVFILSGIATVAAMNALRMGW